MPLLIALLLPLVLALAPAASPEPPGASLAIAAYPPGESPDTVSARHLRGQMEARPGERWQLVVGTVDCCYVFTPGDPDVTWAVSQGEDVTVDDGGLLTIAAAVPDGTVVTVTANLGPAGPSTSLRVDIYTPEAQPLVGIWREAAQVACDSGNETDPDPAIGELRFSADGSFSVTWHPFEIFVDYWGTYEADPETGELTLTMESSMGPPPDDFDGEGTFEIRDDGSLAVHGIWFGTGPGSEATASGCGHVFTTWPQAR